MPVLDAGEVIGIGHLTDADEVRAALARLAVAPGPEQSADQPALPGQPGQPGKAEASR